MGYTTLKGGKIVIWTTKRFIPDPYPFNDEGQNWTFFYENLRGEYFCCCLAVESDVYKRNFVGEKIGIDPEKIVLKSKASHHKQMTKR